MTLDHEFVERFWDDDTDHLVQRPLTTVVLSQCERLLGVTLPAEYLTLIRVRNGGTVAKELSAFPTTRPTSYAADHVPFAECFGIGDRIDSIAGTPFLNAECGHPDGLVLLSGEGHSWVALDYREADEGKPTVVWYDNEAGEDLTLARSFGEFLAGLQPPPDPDG